MRAMVVNSYDDPLEPAEVAAPELAPGFARVEILTCGICMSDVKTAQGRMPFSDRLSLPHVPGHEICGRVVETDPVGVVEPGTTVVVYHLWPCRRCSRCRAGQDNLCRNPRAWTGFTEPGGFQEQLIAPLDRLVCVPDGIDSVHAAPMTCALGTAYHSVIARGLVTAGTNTIVIGLGGVGIHALQVADQAGARALGIDPSRRALAVAADLGLRVAPAHDTEVERRAHMTTGGEGADVVIDTVGSPQTIAQAERLVRAGGRIVAVGYAMDSAIALPSPRVVLEEIELVGSRYVRLDELERAIQLVARGRVQTVIDRVVPLERANEAIDALKAGEVVGRAVVDVAGVT